MRTSVTNLSLFSVSHYHNPHGIDPNPRPISPQSATVELMTGGRGWLEHEGEWVEVLPGHLLWNIPGEATIGRSDYDDPYRCLSVAFRYDGVLDRNIPRISRWADIDEVRQFTERSIVLAYADDFESETLCESLFAELHFRARYYAWTMQNKRLPVPLQRVTELIDQGYHKSLSIEMLADASGWSVPHLHTRFREQFGETPHQAIIARRLRAAKVRLASTNDPIKQIAEECGFANATAFCTTFKRFTSNTPANFRMERMGLTAQA
ncbi:AraC family transcriptional regulator [Rubellicoccus peritrichatus]|uniref:AraC family transcriptional regulator n=1 Tax=Rubellicoccus peritrichatus TaxID=3080537 RepID=A0AAQ3LCZ5_9BACT|nr:AraC family transcriptional regulator [Puniceicoccus sp. CR14]WOO42187.1 AraC family transcriptional regulator [Puniceicoccus sp. CR14]